MMHPNNLADVGIIVGRFQVPRLHPGQLELLLHICRQHRKVIVLLGVPPVLNRENPLDYEARAQMINRLGLPILTAPLFDNKNNEKWSEHLDFTVSSLISPTQTVTLYGCRDSFISAYSGKFHTEELVGDQQFWSGSRVRDETRKTVNDDYSFRAGVIWARQNMYKMVVPTVDIIIYNNYGQLLLARKPDESLFRFVGGFADANSPSYEDDAIREVNEETGLKVISLKYETSFLVDDWRYKGVDKIKTLVFSAYCGEGGGEKPCDDLEGGELKWFDCEEINDNMIVPQHRKILQYWIDE